MRIVALSFAILVGSILDRTTGQPLPDVIVSTGAARTTSRADGSYRLTKVKPGAVRIAVHSDDVPPQQFDVTVRNATTHADLRVCSTTLDYSCAPSP